MMPEINLFCIGARAAAALVFLAFQSCLNAQQATKENILTGIVQFTDKEIIKKIQDHGFQIAQINDLRRDEIGKKLFIIPEVLPLSNSSVLIVAADNVMRREIPAHAEVYLDENESIVAWFRDMQLGVHFSSGEFVHLGSNGKFSVSTNVDAEAQFIKTRGLTVSGFDVDPSGTFFIFQGIDGGTYLGKTKTPSVIKCVSTNFVALNVFYENGNIYICGWPKHSKGAGCLVLNQKSDSYILKKEFNFSGMNSVIDIDQSGSRVLLNEETDFSPRLYVQSLTTGKRVCIGRADKRVFFLQDNIFGK